MGNRKALLIAALSLAAAPVWGGAQTLSRTASGLPGWVDDALIKAGVWGRYQLTSSLNPDVRWGDFDGDGFPDVALGVVASGSRRRGILIVHRVDQTVHVVGAGQPVGNGRDELPADAAWDVERLGRHRDVIRMDGWGDWHGCLAWTGQTYAWVQDSH